MGAWPARLQALPRLLAECAPGAGVPSCGRPGARASGGAAAGGVPAAPTPEHAGLGGLGGAPGERGAAGALPGGTRRVWTLPTPPVRAPPPAAPSPLQRHPQLHSQSQGQELLVNWGNSNSNKLRTRTVSQGPGSVKQRRRVPYKGPPGSTWHMKAPVGPRISSIHSPKS